VKKKDMKKGITFILTRLLVIILLLTLSLSLAGCKGKNQGKQGKVEEQVNSADYSVIKKEVIGKLLEDNPSPGISSIGGDWLIFAFAKSGEEIPDTYLDAYYDNVRAEVKRKKGVLSDSKYTEYERVILSLESIGKDFRNIEGYDLYPYLDDYEKVFGQGVNAEIFALITSNVCGIEVENEERYLKDVISELNQPLYMDDPEMTDYLSMGIEALSFYMDSAEAKAFVDESVKKLSEAQLADGSLGNCESTAECIIALSQIGIDPLKDERFIKEGKTLYDGLMVFYKGEGGFTHMAPGDERIKNEVDPMSSEKALLGLCALELSQQGKRLYE